MDRPPPALPNESDIGESAVDVEQIICAEDYLEQVVTLREIDGQRRLKLTIGIFEACTLDRAVKKTPMVRPLTHTAWITSLRESNSQIESVSIHSRKNETLFAELRLTNPSSRSKVDLRPSDAITLGLVSGCAIFVANGLLNDEARERFGEIPPTLRV